ncbi:MAG: phosphate ABC transporter substrate-binding protein, partial [Chloroflexi bacterium]|nr:phosphate ABC transporter substrate-binding protein [Chloroflexota bacterium]
MIKKITGKWLGLILISLLSLTITLTGCTSSLAGTITEGGSTTVQPLAEKLAEAFKKNNPDVEVVIGGGGSSVGVTSVNDGTVDIGAISRELKTGEPALITHLLARDGIALIVNKNSTISGLTKDQIKAIYNGTIANWNQVGGPDKTIHVVAREEGSGTRTAFQDMVMGTDKIITSAILQSSNGAIRTTVAGDAQSIGFISFGYIDNTVKAVSINSVAATATNAKNGTYPIVRPLYFVTKAQPEGLVKTFLDFCKSAEGQKIV